SEAPWRRANPPPARRPPAVELAPSLVDTTRGWGYGRSRRFPCPLDCGEPPGASPVSKPPRRPRTMRDRADSVMRNGGAEAWQGASPRARKTRWAIILAGGDGTRLRELTRRLAGDDRPKQFCPLLGDDALLDETRRRVGLGVPTSQTFFSVTAAHERFYAPLLADVRCDQIVVQPRNRGTAPAILYALLRMAEVAPNDAVAILPSDHFVSDDARFMAHVDAAFDLVGARPDLVALLGLAPDRAETEYGWIEPAQPVIGPAGPSSYGVRRFWEK